jgi:hypothetical protein
MAAGKIVALERQMPIYPLLPGHMNTQRAHHFDTAQAMANDFLTIVV